MVIVNLSMLDRCLEWARYYDHVARLWHHVEMSYGKEIRKQTKSFSFIEAFKDRDYAVDVSKETHHNAIKLKNGEVLKIVPFPKPVIPEDMPVEIKT